MKKRRAKRFKPYVEQPRIRTVKPQLYKHELLCETEEKTQLPILLGFIALFSMCDGDGHFRWRPKRLKAEIFPYRKLDFEHILEALESAGFIKKFAYEDGWHGCIPSWFKHQVIGKHEPKTPFPRLLPSGEVVTQDSSAWLAFKATLRLSHRRAPRAGHSQGLVWGREGKGKGWGGKGSGRGRKAICCVGGG